MARRRQFSHPGKKLDHTAWDLSSGFASALSAGNQAFEFSSVGSQPSTLLRIRGEISCWLDGTDAPPVGIQVNYGIILVPEGSGSTPRYTPFGDANAPWLLYGQGTIGYEEAVTDVVAVQNIMSFSHTIDNKAMRIIRPDVEMQLVVENTSVGGAGAINFSYNLRWLQGF